MEVGLGINLRVGEEVDERSLLDEFVLLVNSVVLDLLLGEAQVLVLGHLSLVSPGVGHLLQLVARVDIIEDRELRTHEVSEVSNLNVAKVEGNEELVMPDHASKPVVVLPAAKSRDSVDRSNVKGEEQQSTARTGQGLVVRRDLLGANGGEEALHEVHVGHVNGSSGAVIGVHVTGGQVGHAGRVVVSGVVLSLVLGLGAAKI
mmetsp:Transcript_19494/g.29959  ORF Transcript_19494/g.29959 Transcript_19494/m.29959 type:complete len:203 (+) Transcript_19494:488-1096(+)